MADPHLEDVPLVEPTDLTDFPGAPFPASLVAAACDSIRDDAGWHIAPSVESTEQVHSLGGKYLFVKSLRLTDVTEIRSITESGTTVLTGWVRYESGTLFRSCGWPVDALIEVDMVDGYETCPPSLFPAVVSRIQDAKVDRSRGSVRLGSLAVSPLGPPNTAAAEAAQPDAVVRRFRIPKSR
jgi:hypothetical protein